MTRIKGRRAASAEHRQGFQRLVAEVAAGAVGLVLMLEASRLARCGSDWHRLIELCSLTRTLIADEQSVYDPREPNDRLLLGVKGTLSEAELMTLRTRLYEGRWNKARKGQLGRSLPTGYVRDPDGRWVKDPDRQVQERLGYVFTLFRQPGGRTAGVAGAASRAAQAAGAPRGRVPPTANWCGKNRAIGRWCGSYVIRPMPASMSTANASYDGHAPLPEDR